MEAPLCKTCKSRHWGTCYTRPDRPLKKPVSEPDARGPVREPRDSGGVEVATTSHGEKRRGRPATGFDKKAYDREKAKARRAAKKETPK